MDSEDIHTPRSFKEGLEATGNLMQHIFTEDDYRSIVINSAKMLENDKASQNTGSVQYRLLQRIREYGTVENIPRQEMEVIKRMANEQFPLQSNFDSCLKVFELQKRLRVLAAANVSAKGPPPRGRKRRTGGINSSSLTMIEIAAENSARKRSNNDANYGNDSLVVDDGDDNYRNEMTYAASVISGLHYAYS